MWSMLFGDESPDESRREKKMMIEMSYEDMCWVKKLVSENASYREEASAAREKELSFLSQIAELKSQLADEKMDRLEEKVKFRETQNKLHEKEIELDMMSQKASKISIEEAVMAMKTEANEQLSALKQELTESQLKYKSLQSQFIATAYEASEGEAKIHELKSSVIHLEAELKKQKQDAVIQQSNEENQIRKLEEKLTNTMMAMKAYRNEIQDLDMASTRWRQKCHFARTACRRLKLQALKETKRIRTASKSQGALAEAETQLFQLGTILQPQMNEAAQGAIETKTKISSLPSSDDQSEQQLQLNDDQNLVHCYNGGLLPYFFHECTSKQAHANDIEPQSAMQNAVDGDMTKVFGDFIMAEYQAGLSTNCMGEAFPHSDVFNVMYAHQLLSLEEAGCWEAMFYQPLNCQELMALANFSLPTGQ